ncbi:MAG: AMP-binding protein [Rhodocyclaceae bacterium]|nr:AMP-binding protein [Rhodocyclaceae bacterium]
MTQISRPVATLMDNGSRWIEADATLSDAGIPHVPLPLFFSPAQRVHAIASAHVTRVLTDRPDEILEFHPGAMPDGQWRALTWVKLPDRESTHSPLPSGTAKITFTSGTTGEPKGVCLSTAQMYATALALAETLAPLGLTRHLCALPLPVLLENIAGVLAPQLLGMTVMAPPLIETGLLGAAGFDVPRFSRCLADNKPDSVILLPQMLEVWLAEIEAGRLSPPNHLRFVAVGGARVSSDTLIRARDVGIPVFEGYGLSECASVVALNHPGADRPGSVGRPLPHLSVTLGDDGEIFIGGQTHLGYLDEPPKPVGALLATGDLGTLDEDGFLFVSGRKKNIIITAFGRNIAPEWIESELQREPVIAQAAVFGEARPWLSAVIVSRSAATSEIGTAMDRVNARLPDYARIQHFIIADQSFTPANGLATANGRPRRPAIATHYQNQLEKPYEL